MDSRKKTFVIILGILVLIILFVLEGLYFFWSFIEYNSTEKVTATILDKSVSDYLYLLQYDKFEDKNDVINKISSTNFDLVILDAFYDTGSNTTWSYNDIETIKNSGDGKIVVSYISIGEAEDYRYYWNDSWYDNPPPWLDEENPNWEGNYKVKYWYPEWQKIIINYVDLIAGLGFDGIFMDIIDAYEYYEDKGVENAAELMVDFVSTLSSHVHEDLGLDEFLLIPQNGEALGEFDEYLAVIDGISLEDLFFNGDRQNNESSISTRLEYLQPYFDAGKFVFDTEYCRNENNIEKVYHLAWENGIIPYVTVRTLDEIIINQGFEP